MGGRYAERIAAGEFGADLELAGVSDLLAEKATTVAGQLGVPGFSSIEELIEHARPDALYIATPDGAHLAPALVAAERGVAFLVEKPLATTVEDAAAIVSAAASAGVVAEVNYSNRWNPPFVATKRAIDRGELGEFVTLSARLNNSIGSPLQRLGWAADTTCGWFLLSHCIDLGYWLHGHRAVSVYASGTRGVLEAHGVPTFDSIRAIVRYEDGSDASYESVWVLPDGMPSPVEFTFRYVGAERAVTVDTHFQDIAIASSSRLDYPATLNWAPNRFADFIAAVRGDREAVLPVSEGMEATRVLVALHRSLETGAVEAI